MANPLKILTVLTASQAVKLEQGVDVNNQKVTGLAAGTASGDAVNYGQVTDLSGAVKSYVDAADQQLQSNLDAASGALKGYIDGVDAAQTAANASLSSSMKTYVDSTETALSGAYNTRINTLSGAVSTAIVAEATARATADASLSSSMKSYVDAANASQDAATAAFSGAIKSYVDAADGVLQSNLDAVSGAIVSYVDAENAAQDAAVAAMSGAFKSYIDAADAQLDSDLTALSSSMKSYVDAEVLAEQTRAEAAEAAISGNLAQEIADRTAADSALSSSMASYVDAETTRALAAEAVLSGNLATEVAARIAADTALSGAYNTRINALSGAVATAITAEATARANADTALSTSLKTYVDAQDSALSGAFDTRISNLSGAVKTYVDAQDNALSSSLKSYVDAADTVLQGNLDAVSGALKGAIDDEAQARADEDLTFLKLDGSRTMTGELKMGGQDIVGAKSGSFSGDVTVGGNLTVNGQLTYINSTNLEVTDKLVTIAKGAADAAAALGAGIEIDGADVSLTLSDAFNKTMKFGGVQYVDTEGAGYNIRGGEAITDVQGDKSILELGRAFGAVLVDRPLDISGSAFTYITTPVVDNKYDVNDAIHALDVAVSGAAYAAGNDVANMKSAYDALRCVVTGTLTSGQVIVNLTTVGGAQFATAEMANVALDVMVDADGTGFTNDLVAIKMFVDGAALKVQIDAPATPSAAFRLIAVNEKDGGLA